MDFTNTELEHLCFVTRVDLNGTRATLEDIKDCVRHSRRRKDPRHIVDSHVSFRDSLKKRIKREEALLTKLENQFISQGGTFDA
tara:strand:- start:263 stop:514 length:252 start_codon:yes stop_codon:yes gene_type:complete